MAQRRYYAQCTATPVIPSAAALPDFSSLCRHSMGVVAYEGDTLVGYLAPEYFFDQHFGTSKGLFCPIHGVGLEGKAPEKLMSRLYQEASQRWIDAGYVSHAIALYENDTAAREMLHILGFGMRCGDAATVLEPAETTSFQQASASPTYTLRELSPEEYIQVYPLEEKLISHLRGTPLFMPVPSLTKEEFLSAIERSDRFFGAFFQERLVGFYKVSTMAENFITYHPSMLNITGAYLLEEHRPNGVALPLLEFVKATLTKDGYRYLGVDCETINPAAWYFWSKSFTTYIYSYHRRHDERILG